MLYFGITCTGNFNTIMYRYYGTIAIRGCPSNGGGASEGVIGDIK